MEVGVILSRDLLFMKLSCPIKIDATFYRWRKIKRSEVLSLLTQVRICTLNSFFFHINLSVPLFFPHLFSHRSWSSASFFFSSI